MSKYSEKQPWIAEREATVCMWKPDYNRGYINNMNTSLLVDVVNFSNRQLEAYVKMLKACGFTGIQVTDICSAWRGSGSWERVHDCFKTIAYAAHANGMKMTLWVWAAEFSCHGWHDEEVVYNAADGGSAYDDLRVYAAFDKYYEIYADMAPYCDRLVAHFYDPGNLWMFEDVIRFAKLLESKFKSRNPNIKMAMDTWGCPDDFPQKLVDAGLQDYMLMELPFLPSWREKGKRAKFREGVKQAGCELGVWGWYTAEYEIDQNPSMIVNAKVLQDVYQQMRSQGDHVMRPVYYSEMDSYHVLNVFSLYCAGNLLINPDRNPDILLREIAEKIAGKEDKEVLLEALHLIQDARSGDRWETYWWREDGYELGTANPAAIRERAEACLPKLQAVAEQKKKTNTIPLPIEAWQLMKLMLPHLEQIRRYAEFRIQMAELETMYANGADPDTLYRRLDQIWEPVPEYNCIIGLWGQPESRVQADAVKAFCKKAGIPVPKKATRRFIIKKRLFEHLCVIQRGKQEPVFVDPCYYEAGLAFGYDETKEIIAEMVEEGLLRRRENGEVSLTDWETHRYDFNI